MRLAVLAALWFVSLCASATAQAPLPSAFDALLKLKTPGYTGGLNAEHRMVAARIRATMDARYRDSCPAAGVYDGQLVATFEKPRAPSLKGVDPELVLLIEALQNPRQEVRDVAAYTIGLLGPSARAAAPFIPWGIDLEDRGGKGGWYNFAYERVACERVVEADFRSTIPNEVLPPGHEGIGPGWTVFLREAAILMARLYLDESVEYPPGMMGRAYGNYAIADLAGPAVPLLAQILDDRRLGPQKRFEAATALSRIDKKEAAAALPALERAADDEDDSVRYQVGQALERLGSEKAIPSIIEQIHETSWFAHWDSQLCEYGPRAIAAENKLIAVMASEQTWPRVAAMAADTLGCLRSAKSIPTLIAALERQDWLTNAAAATALGKVGAQAPDVIRALTVASTAHWSSRVRKAALEALDRLQGKEPPREIVEEGDIEIIVGGMPGSLDHGLDACADASSYSLDGAAWFDVRWREATHERRPMSFRPKTYVLLQPVGTQTFLKTPDGWLFGASGFEGNGTLVHVSQAGVVTEMEDEPGVLWGHMSVTGLAHAEGRYFAFGWEPFKVDDAGALLDLRKDAGGVWSSRRVLVLPSAPRQHAVAPSGQLLLRDALNIYAIVNDRIVPLQCR